MMLIRFHRTLRMRTDDICPGREVAEVIFISVSTKRITLLRVLFQKETRASLLFKHLNFAIVLDPTTFSNVFKT